MTVVLFIIRVFLTIFAAVLCVALMIRLWGGWQAPACIGPQDTVQLCR